MAFNISSSNCDHTIRLDSAHGQHVIGAWPTFARGNRLKVLMDGSLALFLLVLALPVMLLTALLVKLTSRGPSLYSQLRVGLHGRLFTIYKIRTMSHDCERHSGARWATAGDPRITRLGRFLRRTYLDELPQLWNVLKGDMSLVGPRPERPEFTPMLEKAIPHYRDRLAVRPGVTGLAQVQLPADTDIDSVRRKLVYDLYYIKHRSAWIDIRLMLGTTLKMLHIPLSISGRLLCIPGRSAIESAWQAGSVTEPGSRSVQPVARLQPEVV